VRINGLTGLIITKLDALTGVDPLNVATSYSGPEGASFEEFPYHQSILHKAQPEYREFPGWQEPIRSARSFDDLPREAQEYLNFISDYLGIPIVLIGVGPARDEIIWTGAQEALEPAAAGA
jgi:adenylosuccinate synthase